MGLSKKQLKVIAELERRINMCRDFMNDWVLFNQILSAYANPGVDKAQLEKEFLKVKTKLAREHAVLKETVAQDSRIDGSIMNIVYASTDLETMHSQSDVAFKKIQGEWNRALMSINETLGIIENKKARCEAGEKVFLLPVGGGASMGGGGGGGLSDGAKRNLMIIAALIGVAAVIYFVPPLRNMYLNAFRQFFGR